MNKIVIGADHAGINLLKKIKEYLEEKEFECIVITTSDDKDDYPVVANKICEEVLKQNIKGIAICGTGIGMQIACNKVKNIRASICYDEYTATMSVKHNNLNVMCFGERTEVGNNFDLVKRIIDCYLNTSFEGGKHQKRVEMLERMGEY